MEFFDCILLLYGQAKIIWSELPSKKTQAQNFNKILGWNDFELCCSYNHLCCLFWGFVMKKISIEPTSFLIWAWLLFFLGPVFAVSYILAIVLHELGHFFVAKYRGYKLSKFSISSYGFSLSYFDQSLDYKDEILIALAGPFFNLVSAFLMVGLWWIFPVAYFFTEAFVSISVVLALFNLLPAYPLDGGRIFIGIGSHFFDTKTAKKITIGVNLVLSLLFFGLFVVFMFVNFNPTYMLFSFFLLSGVLDLKFVSKYEKVNIFCKTHKNFSKPVVLCVYEDVTIKDMLAKIQTSKTYVFCLILENGKTINLNEKSIIKLSIKYPYNCKLGDIFN